MAENAPDCHKDLDVYETFIKDATNVFLGRTSSRGQKIST